MKIEENNYTKGWLVYPLIQSANQDEIAVYVTENEENEGNDSNHGILSRGIEELMLGMQGLYRRHIRSSVLPEEISGAEIWQDQYPAGIYLVVHTDASKRLSAEGHHIQAEHGKCLIEAATSQGVLYGIFTLLRMLQTQSCQFLEEFVCDRGEQPANPLRMLNHWDNMDGSIERGYSGDSFFFEQAQILINDRTREYARLAASVGINGVVINNVNVKKEATELITDRYFVKLKKLSELFASYGIRLYLSINFAAPMELGGVADADPLNPQVIAWWQEKAKEIWENIPLLGGFLVKADSEGRPGPFTYGRTHGDGANLLADAVKPYGGVVIWRCFVYNCMQDWRDTVTDRAKAGYDAFMPMDGAFHENVILQIKNGPMDFQVREPISPLFGGLKHTRMMLEVQIAQEYTGQQRHVCYLLPWFREILDTDLYAEQKPSTVADLVCGMAAVANTGNDSNWTGHDLAAANLYGFGRLSFDTGLSAEQIAQEWILQTFGAQLEIRENLEKILLGSWPAYENYTAPLGIGWMVNPNVHYGPNVDGYEYDRWGTYHRADHLGIGVDRSESGTNYCAQYQEPLASRYADPKTCPQELILFFHHLPYTYVLPSGKTVIQHIYDTHFEGVEQVEEFIRLFEKLRGLLPEDAYERMLPRFLHQREHAGQWRDVINTYFYRKSGIEDEKHRKIWN